MKKLNVEQPKTTLIYESLDIPVLFEMLRNDYCYLSWEAIFSEMDSADFSKKTRVHDWKNYADEETIRTGPPEKRVYEFLQAWRQAHAEEWD